MEHEEIVSNHLKQIKELKTIMESETSKSGLLNGQIEFLKNREKELEDAKNDLSVAQQKLQNDLLQAQKKSEELNIGKKLFPF